MSERGRETSSQSLDISESDISDRSEAEEEEEEGGTELSGELGSW